MTKNWITFLLLFLSVTVFFATAIPSEGHQNMTEDYSQLSVTRNKIMTAQYECYQKIMQDPIHRKEGPYCNRTWDGWLCWSDVAAGTVSVQRCPDYFQDFNPSEKVTKICDPNGNWFRHPESNRTWTNYTQCNIYTHEKVKTALNLYYLAIIGHGLSITSLLISLGIFFYFKSLSCQRITLHKNLFFSFVCNSVVTIISLTAVANNQELVATNPLSCKVSQFIYLYLMGCNYFWMLCEGIYLHTLIVVAVFAEKQHLMWYYLLGWGFPLIPACIHAVARSLYYNDNCWISSDTHLLYIIHGPICAALLVNLFFLLNIVRVLITKLKDTHKAESNLYMKAVRATLILVPLLGIEFVLFPWRPEGRIAEEVYDYVMHILMHYQGLLVATIFCFFNGEVQAVLRRHWNQYKIQFEHSFSHSDAMRTASYTVSSISDVQGYSYNHDCISEHLNGKGYHDMESVVLKTEKMYG
ncbi:calcitonin gene-related peptide type 1 receptor [Amazona ochrocephala]|uniref:Calcitonin gene-related peptide type 1 receptor n=2 Tax=Amazona TaxID=12929 RepID=A0A0Q3U406_AMAAE|nr:calcitonin gene-related peptide type 1 receptor [Amazona aestiva]